MEAPIKVGDIVRHTDTRGYEPYNRDAKEYVLFRVIERIPTDGGHDVCLQPLTKSYHCDKYGTDSYFMPIKYVVKAELSSKEELEALYG